MANGTRSRLRALTLCGTAALASAAYAADKPADDSGVKSITDFLASYAGKATLPSIKVEKDGAGYRVSFDISTAAASLKSAGVSYDPAVLQFKVFEQDDGQWRVESGPLPPISAKVDPPPGRKNAVKLDVRVEATNLKHVTLLDPKINWISDSHGGADKASMVERGPGVEEFMELGGVKFQAKTASGASGLTTTASEPFGSVNFVMDVDPKGVDRATGGPAKPVHVSAQGEDGAIDFALKDFQPGPLLDAWRFVVAHPQPADYAHDFEALKPVLSALAGDRAGLEESLRLDKLHVLTEAGPVVIDGAAVQIGAANAGADTGFSEHFSARSIKLPEGLAPPIYAPVIPTSFDVGFHAHGFDVEGAVQEWLADAKASGDEIAISDADKEKVRKKLVGARPVVVDIPLSHIRGPSLDLAFEGKITIDASQPTGAVTLTVRNFDQTAQAVQGLGPQAAQQMTPVIAMAKGLAKPGQDGALVWICAVGPDHVVKVNGLPLGKAPF
jgi:hypothetical protein